MKRAFLAMGPAALGLLLGACSSSLPPKDLVNARATYQQAAQGPAAQYAPAQLHTAKQSLDRAEKAFEDSPGADETKDLAYVAQRKAMLAEITGRAVAANDERNKAVAEYQKVQAQQAQQAQADLQTTKLQLDKERDARMAAEQRTKDALAKLAGIQAKQDERGLVLTLSGSVLFASGKSTLLPSAQTRLQDIANALKESKRNITIAGHTDSQGNDDFNMKLSQSRAEAVRNFLVTHGVASDKVKAQGMGETMPIADNGTTEGRANNRRVEIILEGWQPSDTARPSENTGPR
jgi:outer membrane protein OmpA-like peptidoglycan-associated protein